MEPVADLDVAPTMAGLNVPVFEPTGSSDGHRMIASIVLPELYKVMTEEQFHSTSNRTQIREALRRLDSQHQCFWGKHQMYSRKRTVEDTVLCHYYDLVVAEVAKRAAV
jgi:hypothetical protein